jgi:hypothetical protein
LCAKHISIGLFETFETLDQALATNLQDLLNQYGFTKKIAYVKDEGSNLNTMMTFKFIISCNNLDVKVSFQRTCFGHSFFNPSICTNKRESMQRFKICFHQIYSITFAKLYKRA